MYTTTQPINGATQAVLIVHFTPAIQNGKLATGALFRAQRFTTDTGGNLAAQPGPGAYADKAFTPAQLAALRASNPTIDGLITQYEDISNTLGPLLGL
jgi:hypothetical protein